MTPQDLVEQVTSAHRQRDVEGRIQSHPAWHDLSRAERVEAFDATVRQRTVERALDPEGHSGTVKALLARLRR